MLFSQIERDLQAANNKIYRRAFETDREWQRVKLVGLVYLAMTTQDEECLRIMAKAFKNPRTGFMNHTYWEDLDCELPNRGGGGYLKESRGPHGIQLV